MKTVFLLSGTYRPDRKRAVACITELAKTNVEIIVCAPEKFTRIFSESDLATLKSHDVRLLICPVRFGYLAWLKRTLYTLHAEVQFDSIFLLQPESTAVYWLLRTVTHRLRTTFIFGCLGATTLRTRSLWQAFWWQRATNLYSRLASYIYTDSVAISITLQTRGIAKDTIAYIPFQSVDTAAIQSIPAPPVAWDISVVTPLSGIHNLEPLITIVESIPNCRMLIIGDGTDKSQLMNLVKQKSLDGRIQFTGWFPQLDEVISSIKSTRMFVCVSEQLQTQYMLLNAMASAVPVIVMPSELTSGMIEHEQNGLLVTDYTHDLQEKILWCLKEQERRQFLAERALHDIERFSHSAVKQLWQNFSQAVRLRSSLHS